MNNGITITCDSFSYQKNLTNPSIFMKNIQIVNGCQTSHALFRAYQEDLIGVRDVEVLVRIYETRDPVVSRQIAEATNSQTKISDRDLRSNDEKQKLIESILLEKGFYYERKRGQYAEKAADTKIDSMKLGQICMAFFLEMPEKAKTSSDKIFDVYYNDIFIDSFDCDNSIFAFKIFREIERRSDFMTRDLRNRTSSKAKILFLPYGQFHVLYAVKTLITIKEIVVSEDDIPALVDEAIELVTEVASQHKQRSSDYEFFRASHTKRLIDQAIFSAQQRLL